MKRIVRDPSASPRAPRARSGAPLILFLNAVIAFIPISGFYFIYLGSSQALRQRTMYLTRCNQGIADIAAFIGSERAIHSIPVLAPYQRSIIVSGGRSFDSGWQPNGEFGQPNRLYSFLAAALTEKYPAPALSGDEIVSRLSGYFGPATRKTGIIDYRFMYSVLPCHLIDGSPASAILLFDKSDIMLAYSINKAMLFAITFLSAAIAVAMSVLYVKLFLRPLSALARSLPDSSTGAGVLSPPLERSDEIGQLSRALRRSALDLIERKEAVESFTADVLHELKNPLAAIRNGVEILEGVDAAKAGNETAEMLRLISRETGRIERLLFDIKELSAFEERAAAPERCDAAETIREVASLYGGSGLALRIEAEPAPLPLPQEALARVLKNLIDNAIDFSPEPGSVKVSLERREGSLVLAVSDSGPGIPEGEKEKVFRRFYSDRPARGSAGLHSGLGLSIVAKILESRGLGIRCLDNSPSGCRFEIRY
jgi:signal transduction histidine kinase